MNAARQFKGTRYVAKRGYWIARITVRSRCLFLGSFATEEEAARAYDAAAVRAFGHKAHPNFPQEVPDVSHSAL